MIILPHPLVPPPSAGVFVLLSFAFSPLFVFLLLHGFSSGLHACGRAETTSLARSHAEF